MQKVFKTVAVIGLLGLAATGCTKEFVADQETVSCVNTVYYSAGNYYGGEFYKLNK